MFRCLPRGHRTSYSRLALLGQRSLHRVRLNDPSNRAFLRHPVSSLASRPSEERVLAPLVHIVQAAFSPSVAQPKATPVAIRSLGEDLNLTKVPPLLRVMLVLNFLSRLDNNLPKRANCLKLPS